MSATIRKTKTCPAWCANAICGGEHLDGKTYLSATGGAGLDPSRVGVGLELSEPDGDDAASLVLHVDGDGQDVAVLLRPEEARALVEQLLARLDVLTPAGA